MFLPYEIMAIISNYLDPQTLKNISQTHSHFLPLYDSLAWRHVSIRYRYSWPGRVYEVEQTHRPLDPTGWRIQVTMFNDEQVAKVLELKAKYIKELTIRGDFYETGYTKSLVKLFQLLEKYTKVGLKKVNVVSVLNQNETDTPLFSNILGNLNSKCVVNVHLSIPCVSITEQQLTVNSLEQIGSRVDELIIYSEKRGRESEVVDTDCVLKLPKDVIIKNCRLIATWGIENYNYLFEQASLMKLILNNCFCNPDDEVGKEDRVVLKNTQVLTLEEHDVADYYSLGNRIEITECPNLECIEIELGDPRNSIPDVLFSGNKNLTTLVIHSPPQSVDLYQLLLTSNITSSMKNSNIELLYFHNVSFAYLNSHLIKLLFTKFQNLKHVYIGYENVFGYILDSLYFNVPGMKKVSDFTDEPELFDRYCKFEDIQAVFKIADIDQYRS